MSCSEVPNRALTVPVELAPPRRLPVEASAARPRDRSPSSASSSAAGGLGRDLDLRRQGEHDVAGGVAEAHGQRRRLAERGREGEDLDRLARRLQRAQRLHRPRHRAVDHVDELDRPAELRQRRAVAPVGRGDVVDVLAVTGTTTEISSMRIIMAYRGWAGRRLGRSDRHHQERAEARGRRAVDQVAEQRQEHAEDRERAQEHAEAGEDHRASRAARRSSDRLISQAQQRGRAAHGRPPCPARSPAGG